MTSIKKISVFLLVVRRRCLTTLRISLKRSKTRRRNSRHLNVREQSQEKSFKRYER